ncbi:hypothetical protein ACQEU8_02540 [Streptomyces sp. CA-250714]|uniref:hypothetical protein n=1 Tax=Streptomyces sp. CA-250714 TaxID=3240060 RepID=UPI003D942B2F
MYCYDFKQPCKRPYATHSMGANHTCKLCGARAVTPDFEAIFGQEMNVKGEEAQEYFMGHSQAEKEKAKLFAMIDDLTPKQMRAYGVYRSAALDDQKEAAREHAQQRG